MFLDIGDGGCVVMFCNFQVFIIVFVLPIFWNEFTYKNNFLNKIIVTKKSELRQRAVLHGTIG